MHVPADYYLRILPELVLTATAVLIMLIEGGARLGSRAALSGTVALIGTAAALASVAVQSAHRGEAFSGMFRVDGFSLFFHGLIIAATLIVLLLSIGYLRAQRLQRGEFYALLLFATVGMCLMAGSVELIMVFIGLEISSICSYALCGFWRASARSSEAALKYLLLGSFATAFFLYGIALTYGASGSTNLYVIARSLSDVLAGHGSLILVAAALMFVGLAFKVSAAPFQVWTPDVYEGAPVAVTAFMSAGPKAATFAVFLRIFYVALGRYSHTWFWMIWVAAILSMCLGNLGALRQTNMKRMLAYSSIAHAGYVLVAFAALGEHGISAAMFYLACYVAMNLGAFAVISNLAQQNERFIDLHDYAGLGFRFPLQSVCLTICMLSLIGIPLTGGFLGKLFIFKAAFQNHLVGLAIVGLLNSALAAYYYLRVIAFLYMRPATVEVSQPQRSLSMNVAMVACAVGVLWLGIAPNSLLNFVVHSAGALTGR